MTGAKEVGPASETLSANCRYRTYSYKKSFNELNVKCGVAQFSTEQILAV